MRLRRLFRWVPDLRRAYCFRQHYNEERPHEALEQTPPARRWQPSARRYPAKIADPWYDADHEVRRVRHPGDIKWRGEHVFIGEAFAGELVGLADKVATEMALCVLGYNLTRVMNIVGVKALGEAITG